MTRALFAPVLRVIVITAMGGTMTHVHGQEDNCFPADDSNEAKSFGILSVPLAFTGAGGAPPGAFSIGLEAATLPAVPEETAQPTSCRPGKGPENTNPVPGMIRLRIGASVSGWRAELGWVPPVEMAGVRTNLVGVALSRRVPLGDRWSATPRVHALLGSLRAPVTCDDEALEDPLSECFGGTRSDDRWSPGVFGAEVALARSGRVMPHLGVGYTMLRPRFQVDFTNAAGETDNRKVEVDLTRIALFAGAGTDFGRVRLSGEGYITLGDRIAFRVLLQRSL